MSVQKTILFRSTNILAFICTIAVNAFAGSTRLLNGKTSGEVSDMFPTLITPAGFTFSIWGVIYTLLLVFIVYQALPRNSGQPFLRQISFLFALSGILNIFWLFLWHYELITLSLLLMFALLASLIAIYLRLNIGREEVSLRERLCVHVPFSVYLGWITVASIANVAVALTAVGWDGGGIEQVTWAVLVIIVALLITLTSIATRKDAAYSLVIVWALAGITVKQIENQTIVLTAEAAMVIILAAVVVMAVVSRLKSKMHLCCSSW